MGGVYDGGLGLIAALAVVEAVQTSGYPMRHPIEWINFAAEEATMAGGTTGSQAMASIFDLAILDRDAWDGQPVRHHFEQAGLDPTDIASARRMPGALSAFIELHIEQSRRLESLDKDIAVVSGFTGIRRYRVEVPGVANHAGTTPMAERQDALVSTAPLIEHVRSLAITHDMVTTIGDLRVYPGSPNVIPNRVSLVIETRALSNDKMDTVETLLEKSCNAIGAGFEPIVRKPPVSSDHQVQDAILQACRSLGLTHLDMPSGAGHDAMVMSHICPQGILFVPSVDGISHSRHEFTRPEECLNGAKALLGAVLTLDKQLNPNDV